MAARRLRLLALGFVAVAASYSCHTNEVEIPEPSGPSTPVGSVPVNIVVAPPVAPKPAGTPTPPPSTPSTTLPPSTPSTTLPPSTPPTPPPSNGACKLPPGVGDSAECERRSAAFLDQLEDSLDEVTSGQPQLFDKSDAKCGNCYKVVDPDAYVSAVASRMQARGFCTKIQGDEIGVKNTNDFNDQYDVLTSDNYIRRGEGAYRATCKPSWF
jgi:hypothetical protein